MSDRGGLAEDPTPPDAPVGEAASESSGDELGGIDTVIANARLSDEPRYVDDDNTPDTYAGRA